jgi:hypothetical protein
LNTRRSTSVSRKSIERSPSDFKTSRELTQRREVTPRSPVIQQRTEQNSLNRSQPQRQIRTTANPGGNREHRPSAPRSFERSSSGAGKSSVSPGREIRSGNRNGGGSTRSFQRGRH